MKGRSKPRDTKQPARRQKKKPDAERDMLVIAFGNQKGGVGKSTLLIHLAALLQQSGLLTTVLDLDVQKSVERYAENRARLTGEEAPVVVHGSADNLKDMVETSRAAGVDAVLIDCPGALDRTLMLASVCADVCVVPTRSSSLDQAALGVTLEFLQAAGKIHKCLVVLNAAVEGRDGGVREVLEIADKYGARVAETRIDDNRAYSVSLAKGLTVADASVRSVPARQMQALLDEIKAFHDELTSA